MCAAVVAASSKDCTIVRGCEPGTASVHLGFRSGDREKQDDGAGDYCEPEAHSRAIAFCHFLFFPKKEKLVMK